MTRMQLNLQNDLLSTRVGTKYIIFCRFVTGTGLFDEKEF
jgi:hypothetical protein